MSKLLPRCPVLGLVGGIGSGKSEVAAGLARRGGCLVAGDPLGHAALRQPSVRAEVVARWGDQVVGQDGEIDRTKLGALVFADADERAALEAIVHPWISRRLREQLIAAKADPNCRFVVLDAAIMLEAGWRTACDVVVYVDAPRAVRLKRVAAQRGWSAADVVKREQAQLPLALKAACADAALDNSGGPKELEAQVDALLSRLGIDAKNGAACGFARGTDR
jgi:dephospho-CoA kinase